MLHTTRKSTWRRSALLVLAAVLVMTVLAACGGKKDKEGSSGLTFAGAGKGTVVATYKDGTVTEPEFNKYLDIFNIMQPGYEQVIAIPQFKEQLLQQYVSYKILSAQATEATLKKAGDETDKQMKSFEDTLKTNADVQKTLDDKKVSNADVKTYLNLMLVVVEHMNSQVTDDEMKAEYEKNIGNYNPVTVRHILVATTDPADSTKTLRTKEEALARAKEVKAKLDAGGDWTALAKTYSDDTGSKDNGGQYVDAKASDWVEGFKNAALTQPLNKIGDPVETEYGYHVILVEKRDQATYDKLTADQKSEVQSVVAYNHMNTFMTDEMPKQDVKITLPEAAESPAASTDASASPASSESPAASGSPAASESPAANK
ncbi:foldase protein PrsA [Paenibacillus sp. YAF4_2]|uniref:peptidylprolyl isomerase n=1 Tax=Paenibacillus sp. YAF4_2 TaxID=3233085 RepID=UPI003F9D57AB